MNPIKEFINALVYPGEEEFSPKHLAEFAVDVLSDPYLKMKDIPLMLAYILPLIADKATWPGQRERIRKRFAEAVGQVAPIKYEYFIKEKLWTRAQLKVSGKKAINALIQGCRKIDDEEFVRAAVREIKRHAPVPLK